VLKQLKQAISENVYIGYSYLEDHVDLECLRGPAAQVSLEHLDHLGHLSLVHVEIALQIKSYTIAM